MYSPAELTAAVAARARALRLSRGRTQADLAAAAGVSLASLKRFEGSGEIAFSSLVRLALTLGATAELASWFALPEPTTLAEALAAERPRQRGRRR